MNKTRSIFVSCLAMLFLIIVSASCLGIKLYYAEQEVNALQVDLNNSQTILASIAGELTTTKEKLHDETKKNIELNELLSNTTSTLEIANMTIADLKKEEYRLVYIGEYKLTHYYTERREHICGTGNGITATGTVVTPGRTIAVDPSVIPYGTKVYIEGYGWRIAEDCGGAVNGNHIDIAVDTHSNALAMGIKNGGVWILIPKTS